MNKLVDYVNAQLVRLNPHLERCLEATLTSHSSDLQSKELEIQ